MSTRGPSQVSSNGLIFYYDTYNNKSYMGEPTVNYAYDQNPRIDSSYSAWSSGYGGTFTAKHPDPIRVYNDAGSELTNYVNTGVTDWTNTYHAIWTFDSVLQRPVVTMRDLDGQWKAKYLYIGINFNSLGMTVGSKYTISWLQWTDNLSKRAVVGLYTKNNSGTYNFWDGLSDGSVSSTNTLTNTWQRVYHTYTVTSNWNLSDSFTQIYMYGMYYVNATMKIADVQFELKDHPTQYSKLQTRSVTNGLVDLTGNYAVNLTSAGYNSNANITFNGSSNYITAYTIPDSFWNAGSWSVSVWIKFNSVSKGSDNAIFGHGAAAGSSGLHLAERSSVTYFGFYANDISGTIPLAANKWYNIVWVFNYSTKLKQIYVNGVFDTSGGSVGYSGTGTNTEFGRYPWSTGNLTNGVIDLIYGYNRVLSASEVLQNYNRSKSRYGL